MPTESELCFYYGDLENASSLDVRSELCLLPSLAAEHGVNMRDERDIRLDWHSRSALWTCWHAVHMCGTCKGACGPHVWHMHRACHETSQTDVILIRPEVNIYLFCGSVPRHYPCLYALTLWPVGVKTKPVHSSSPIVPHVNIHKVPGYNWPAE